MVGRSLVCYNSANLFVLVLSAEWGDDFNEITLNHCQVGHKIGGSPWRVSRRENEGVERVVGVSQRWGHQTTADGTRRDRARGERRQTQRAANQILHFIKRKKNKLSANSHTLCSKKHTGKKTEWTGRIRRGREIYERH